jgi:DNA-binding NarL/FixJ family response regulator
MAKKIRVLIVEDDRYALEMMSLLLRCDWRTQVIGKIAQMAARPEQLQAFQADLILVGGDGPEQVDRLSGILEQIHTIHPQSKIVYAARQVSPALLGRFAAPGFFGCLLKAEIAYSLVWALVLAARGEWVITPGLNILAREQQFSFQHQPIILDGTQPIAGLTAAEAESARQAYLFSISSRWLKSLGSSGEEIPNALQVHMQRAYRELGMQAILRGEIEPGHYFAGQDHLIGFFSDQFALMWQSARSEQKKDLFAYYLLTVPQVLYEPTPA